MARFDQGWIKMYRSAVEGDIGSNAYCLSLFVRLLSWANLRPTTIRFNGAPREIPRGALVVGVRELASAVGCGRETVHRHLQYLERRDTICREVGTEGTLITVKNFERYQSPEGSVGREWDTDGTLAGHEPNAGLPPIEEVKKERSKERRSRAAYAQAFEDAYGKYPRKEGKSGAFKAYQKLAPGERAQVPVAIANYARAKSSEDPRFLKHFSTFMGEWRDWLAPETGSVAAIPSINVVPINLEAL